MKKVPSPSFSAYKPASLTSSRIKKENRSVNTCHELLLCRELRRKGILFQRHVSTLPGKPDIVFRRARLVVFCDGDFWHGRRWSRLKLSLKKGVNSPYWISKIASNIQRDKRISSSLRHLGWSVLRVWETDIKNNPVAVANHIMMRVSIRLTKLN